MNALLFLLSSALVHNGLTELVLPSHGSDIGCPQGWLRYTGVNKCTSCIKYIMNDKKSWWNAREDCRARGGDLVEIMNENMNKEFIFFLGNSLETFWIGLQDLDRDNQFHWLNQEHQPRYLNWAQGRPSGRGDQKCGKISMLNSTKGQWLDEQCWNRNNFLCEMTPPSHSSTFDQPIPLRRVCPFGWIESSSSETCIKFYHIRLPWKLARRTCWDEGGDLVKILNPEKNQLITKHNLSNKSNIFWTGLHERDEGVFKWLNEEDKPQYSNWHPGHGEPNDRKSRNNCGTIHKSGFWLDPRCPTRHAFICEKSQSKEGMTSNVIGEAPSDCPPGWSESSSSKTCIKVYNVMKPWSEARDICKVEGGDLVRIVDFEMNQLINSVGSDDHKLRWIGFHERKPNGTFRWLDDNHEPPYTHWFSKEPDAWVSENDCAQIHPDGFWKDGYCGDKSQFVCEKYPIRRPTKPEKSYICPPDWITSPSSETCIKFFDERKTWDNAQKTCKAKQGNLVKILTFSMNELIMRNFSSDAYWIGMRGSLSTNKFHWLDEHNKPLPFHLWRRGEPKETGFCARLTSGLWDSMPCTSLYKFICERSLIAMKLSEEKKQPCLEGWAKSPSTGTCIKIHHVKKSWSSARQKCKNEGGDLVRIMERDMNDFLSSKTYCDRNEMYWTGLTERKQEGKFYWHEDLEPPNYINWGVHEPNNSWSKQDCMALNLDVLPRGKWSDQTCTDQHKFICERPPGPIPCVRNAPGWFGRGCRYKCHCKDSQEDCNKFDGSCKSGCDPAWFGQGCQYQWMPWMSFKHLTFTNSSKWLTDNDENTCNPGYDDRVDASLYWPIPLTLVQIVVEDVREEIRLFTQHNSSEQTLIELPCAAFKVDDRTLDIVCNGAAKVGLVILKGEGVKKLCALYISKGQNVALKQPADENSSRYYIWPWFVKFAVDGNISTYVQPDRWWRVDFPQAVNITQFLIYTRRGSQNSGCNNCVISVIANPEFGNVQPSIYNRSMREMSGPGFFIIVPSPHKDSLIRSVKIETNYTDLNLYEVVVFGEISCPYGTYGKECEYRCNCVRNTACFVHSGGCPAGCALGYEGEDCQNRAVKFKFANPANLTRGTEFIVGRPSRPLILNCNADIVGLSSRITMVKGVQISRLLQSSGTFEELVDFHKVPLEIATHMEKLWRVTGTGADSRKMNVQLVLMEPTCEDAAIYACTVRYRDSQGQYLETLTGQQNLIAKVAIHNLQMSIAKTSDTTVTCTVEGPEDLILLWSRKNLKYNEKDSIEAQSYPVTKGSHTDHRVLMANQSCTIWKHTSTLSLQEAKLTLISPGKLIVYCFAQRVDEEGVEENLTTSVVVNINTAHEEAATAKTTEHIGKTHYIKASRCRPGWTKYIQTDHCIRIFNTTNVNWQQAYDLCKREDAFLVQADDDEKEGFLRKLYRNISKTNDIAPKTYWVGLRRMGKDSKFRWNDVFEEKRYPNLGQDDENETQVCGAIRFDERPHQTKAVFLISRTCDSRFSYICEQIAIPPDQMRNPSTLSWSKAFEAGPHASPLVINCNAEMIGLPAYENRIRSLELWRADINKPDSPTLIATYRAYYRSEKYTNTPEGRDWKFRFTGGTNKQQVPPPSSRFLNLEWTINAPTCADAGLYECRVIHKSPRYKVAPLISTGFQFIRAKEGPQSLARSINYMYEFHQQKKYVVERCDATNLVKGEIESFSDDDKKDAEEDF